MAAQPSHDLKPILTWACYLGSSWTWVIGMLFPVLLLYDFGFWGWLVFAVPNVVGAAAMGFVLRDAQVSQAVVQRHATACLWFSEVTMGFHLLAVAWVASVLYGTAGLWLGLIAVAVPLAFAKPTARPQRTAAVAVTLVSLALLLVAQFLDGAWTNVQPMQAPEAGLWLFAPGAVLGFLLCPYLDLTFHRARQSTAPAAGRAAFTLGFVGVFGLMIVFSLCYAGLLARPLLGDVELSLPASWATVLAIHVVLQAGLTVWLHGSETVRFATRSRAGLIVGWLVVNLPVVIFLLLEGDWLAQEAWRPHDRSLGEWFYRCYLLLYGTVFPAYVWLCMLPRWRDRRMPPRSANVVFAVAAALSLPMGYLGFVAGWFVWMPAAVAVVALARVPVELLPSQNRAGSALPPNV